jgi:putative FmdB family regulatory protein
MPRWDFICPGCGLKDCRQVSVEDRDQQECPECGQHMDRQPSAPSIQFRGAGFYVNDYARKDKQR